MKSDTDPTAPVGVGGATSDTGAAKDYMESKSHSEIDIAEHTRALVEAVLAVLREKSTAVRAQAYDYTETAAAYTRGKPLKGVLIAAAVGAVSFALLSSLFRGRD